MTDSKDFDAVKGLTFSQVELVVLGKLMDDMLSIINYSTRSEQDLDGLKATLECASEDRYPSSSRQFQECDLADLLLTAVKRLEVKERSAA